MRRFGLGARVLCALAIAACGGGEPVEEAVPEYAEGAYATVPSADEGTDLRFTEVARESGIDFVHDDLWEVFDWRRSADARDAEGGTSLRSVRHQLEMAGARLAELASDA